MTEFDVYGNKKDNILYKRASNKEDIKYRKIVQVTFEKELKNLGFKRVILSPELTNAQIANIDTDLEKEILCYGNTCVMTSEHCPIGACIGGFTKDTKCSMPCLKNDKFYLRDRLNLEFRVIPDNIECQSTIYNCKITSIETKNLNVDSIRIDVIDESIKEISKIIDVHKKGDKLKGDIYTNAHASRHV